MCILAGSEIMHPFHLHIGSLIIETSFLRRNMFKPVSINEGEITKMRSKNVVKMLTFLTVLGIMALFGNQANSQTVNFFMESIEGRSPAPDTTPEAYDGPQTVKGVMNAFDAAYNRKYSKTRVIASFNGDDIYKSEFAISGEIDTRYPRVEWLQMLLERGITIENFDDYRIYLSKRHTLAFLEDNPNLRTLKLSSISPTKDWKIYKTAYIDKLANKHVHAKIRETLKQVKRIKKQAKERDKAQIERTEVQLERIKAQFESFIELEIPHNQKRLERTKAQIERIKTEFERAKTLKRSPNTPKRNMRKTSPYPPL